MRRRLILFALGLWVFALGAAQAETFWPNGSHFDRLSQIGARIGVVFSPDLAQPGCRGFYEALGFAYFDDPDWANVLSQLRMHNSDTTRQPIEFLILETHGTNGNGLKLQDGKKPSDARSYIAIGALQEWLEPIGIHRVYLSACNAGLLLRPEIYHRIDPTNTDPLFLPPTRGIIDASPDFDPAYCLVEMVRRKQSNLETLIHGKSSELAPAVRQHLGQRASDKPFVFVVSSMLIQLLLNDPRIELVNGGHAQEKSTAKLPRKQNERLFQRFLKLLADVAAREVGGDPARAPHTARAQSD